MGAYERRWATEGRLIGPGSPYRKRMMGRRISEVDATAAPPWLRLSTTFKATGFAVDYRVCLTTTRPRFGGLRWWFVCPLTKAGRPCTRRVGKLAGTRRASVVKVWASPFGLPPPALRFASVLRTSACGG
jgi:hypothetical protein